MLQLPDHPSSHEVPYGPPEYLQTPQTAIPSTAEVSSTDEIGARDVTLPPQPVGRVVLRASAAAGGGDAAQPETPRSEESQSSPAEPVGADPQRSAARQEAPATRPLLRRPSHQEERKESLAVARRKADHHRRREADPGPGVAWSPSDARLEGDGNSFEGWFNHVTPDGRRLKDDIETTLAPMNERIGLEVGGPGSALFGGFTEGFFAETRGVALTDTRHADPHHDMLLTRDQARNHDVIAGDLMSPYVHQAVTDWLDGRRLGLVVERLYAGETSLPREPFRLGQEAGFWYKLVDTDGLMFLQVPKALTPYMAAWQEKVAAAPGLDVRTDTFAGRMVLRLHKLAGAPEELPLLDARSALRIQRSIRAAQASQLRSLG